jgi:hypothetical protein
MDVTGKSGVKEQLRAMAAGRGDGIDLDSPERWMIENLKDSISFFRNLDCLIPHGSVLYFEGCEILPEVAHFYEANKASNPVCVTRDTIFPIPETFHVSMTTEVRAGIIDLLNKHSLEACFNHVKAYGDEKLLFAFHDAFDGSDLLVSDRVPEQSIQTFCSALRVSYRREPNVNKRDPEQLRRLLWAIENSHKLRINWPWWKKALFFWKIR